MDIDNSTNVTNETKEQNEIASQYNFNTIILSGGGSKGFAMLGALQYMYDRGYMDHVLNFAGTSIGGIIAYLLIIGMTPIEIVVYLCKHKITDRLKHFNLVAMLQRQGAINFSIISDALEKLTIEKVGYLLTMKDIPKRFNKKLVVTTYNLTENKVEYLSDENYPDLPCLTALKMTASIPFIFEEVKYFNKYYIDGGILENFPIEYFDKDNNVIFGVNLRSIDIFNPESNIAQYFMKIIQIPLNKWTENRVNNASKRCKILEIQLDNMEITKFDVNNHEKLELFSKGYELNKNYFES